MVKPPRVSPILLAALLAVVGVALWLELHPRGGTFAPLLGVVRDADAGKASPLPRIALSRLDAQVAPTAAGETDVFQFGAPSTKMVPGATPRPVEASAPVTMAPVESPTPPPVPVMNVKYIGSVDDKRGLKVAVLMTDRKEVLTGRAGDVVANRLKIVSIGLESVDVQDVGSDHVRRIPLRAN
jgi:hypothetical protein